MKKMKKIVLPMMVFAMLGSTFQVQGASTQTMDVAVIETLEREYVDFEGKLAEDSLARDILHIPNERVVSNNGFWERSFPSNSIEWGRFMNVWYSNNANGPAVVSVQVRLNNGSWANVSQFTVPAGQQLTRQVQMMPVDFNATMRATVSSPSGDVLEGNISVRQTNTPLRSAIE